MWSYLLAAAQSGSGFMPHGMCYLWEPELLWLHVISDALTGAAYWAIPPALVVLVVRARQQVPEGAEYGRRDLPLQWVFLAFGIFIVACGSTHLLAVWNVWHADYWLSGGVKAVTAVASVATAVALPPLIPKALKLIRDARESEIRRVELERANEELRDVRDALQQELESASEDLQTMTQEVTRRREAMEKALEEARQARDEAAAASQAKSDFLAVMSHELRTPLNAIIGYTDLVEIGAGGGESKEEQRAEHLERIRVGARHLLRIIDDILVFSRSDGTADPVSTEEIELPRLVGEIAGLLEPEASRKGIRLEHEADPVSVVVDRERLVRIMTNLVANAVKFTEDGRVSVQARLTDGTLRFSVEDTGPGIPPEHRDRIFEAFWQVDQSRTRKAGGTGLGLSISRRIARELGGDVTVESEVGRGSRFTLTVPIPEAGSGPSA